jgi:hypothetical protein
MKKCNKCNLEKPLGEFYTCVRKDRPSGCGYKISHICKECSNASSRERYASGKNYKQTRKNYSHSTRGKQILERANIKHYESIKGRACHLFNSAKRRHQKWEFFDLDRVFIEEKLSAGKCEVTGLPFDFTSPGDSRKNPFAPSIDRIDNSLGYTKNNVRIVLWSVNLMHGEMTDEQLIEMCKAVIKGLEK